LTGRDGIWWEFCVVRGEQENKELTGRDGIW